MIVETIINYHDRLNGPLGSLSTRVFDTRAATGREHFVCQDRIVAQIFILLAPVVQRLYNAIHRINHYPADSAVCFVNT